jgi:hypothetical protein
MPSEAMGSPDYRLRDEVRALRRRVLDFVEEQVIPVERQIEEGGPKGETILARLQAEAKAEGLWALGLPREVGGGGLSFLEYVFINEVIGRSEAAMFALGTEQTQDALMLYRYGTPSQQERWLQPLVDGRIWPSVTMTEPEVAGSDPTLIQTTARLEGDTWVINRHKWFTTGANKAAFATVFCVTDPEAPPHRRASLHFCSDRYAGIRDCPDRTNHGSYSWQSLRDSPRRCPRTVQSFIGAPWGRIPHRARPARARSDLPCHAVVGTGPAGPRPHVPACPNALCSWLFTGREADHSTIHCGFRGGDPSGSAVNASRLMEMGARWMKRCATAELLSRTAALRGIA